MRAGEISIKTKMIYAAAVCLILVFLWLGNEGSSPLIYLGSELQHSVGLIDSQYSLVIQESVAMNGIVANTPKYVLNRGSYTVWLNYTAQEADSVLELWEQGRKLAAWTIDPSKTHITADFTLTSDAQQLQFQINYSGKGPLTIKELSFQPQTMFYTDTLFMMAVFLIGSVAVWLSYSGKIPRPTQEQIVDYSIILGVALLASTPTM